MNTGAVIAIVVCTVSTVTTSMLVRLMIRQTWASIGGTWPPSEDGPAFDAEHRRFQSLSIGVINLGFSVHAAVDRAGIHLEPTRFLRWMGGTPTFWPWEDVKIVTRGTRWSMIRIGVHSVKCPTWFVEGR